MIPLGFVKASAPPEVIEPNTVYFISNGATFSILLSNKDGTVLRPMEQADGGLEPFLLMGVGNE